MRKILFLLVALMMAAASQAGVIVIEGKYQNKNLYVQNGFSDAGVGFCAYAVTINGQQSTDEVNSSAFEIDFTQFQLKPGQEVVVEIKHKDGCVPKILNPEVIRPQATFTVPSITISNEGQLKWTATNETGSLPFIVEQFRWNKWIKVGEVEGKGTPGNNEYAFQVTPHSGENKLRVKQVGYGGKSQVSPVVTLSSKLPELTFSATKNLSDVMFSGETMYEIYDAYGTILKKGFGKDVKMESLPRGNYYLCYDNTMTELKKK
jgi:uncharacterized protein YxeA